MKPTVIILTIAIISLFMATSCINEDYFPCIRPEGVVYEEARIHAPYHSIHLALHANVFVDYGPEFSTVVVAAENLLDHVITRSNGSTLHIESNKCLRTKSDDIRVYITLPEVKSLRMSGSGNIFVESPFTGQELDLQISGSGNIELYEAVYYKVSTTISGSGDVKLNGTSAIHNVQISGSGKVQGYNFHTDETRVRISGSGNAYIRVFEYLDAAISGSGRIFYKGYPRVKLSITGSGNIKHTGN